MNHIFGVSPAKYQQLVALMQRIGLVEADLEEQFVRSSGPGGQKVNKSSSAVYLKHIPTGQDVKVQISRSQALNRYYARKLLAERMERQALGRQSAQDRKQDTIRKQKRRRQRRQRAKKAQS